MGLTLHPQKRNTKRSGTSGGDGGKQLELSCPFSDPRLKGTNFRVKFGNYHYDHNKKSRESLRKGMAGFATKRAQGYR